ncbi:unnamed protein product [Amoebophrya sp. A25]|nr:unnamed protein product [Amoebophrya sp. A25]|eukprot:GSA25T00013148001.1
MEQDKKMEDEEKQVERAAVEDEDESPVNLHATGKPQARSSGAVLVDNEMEEKLLREQKKTDAEHEGAQYADLFSFLGVEIFGKSALHDKNRLDTHDVSYASSPLFLREDAHLHDPALFRLWQGPYLESPPEKPSQMLENGIYRKPTGEEVLQEQNEFGKRRAIYEQRKLTTQARVETLRSLDPVQEALCDVFVSDFTLEKLWQFGNRKDSEVERIRSDKQDARQAEKLTKEHYLGIPWNSLLADWIATYVPSWWWDRVPFSPKASAQLAPEPRREFENFFGQTWAPPRQFESRETFDSGIFEDMNCRDRLHLVTVQAIVGDPALRNQRYWRYAALRALILWRSKHLYDESNSDLFPLPPASIFQDAETDEHSLRPRGENGLFSCYFATIYHYREFAQQWNAVRFGRFPLVERGTCGLGIAEMDGPHYDSDRLRFPGTPADEHPHAVRTVSAAHTTRLTTSLTELEQNFDESSRDEEVSQRI